MKKRFETLHPHLQSNSLNFRVCNFCHFELVSKSHKRKFKTKIIKYCAFTLAETLITLTIVGIVAALTVPSLIQKHRAEEFESRFKKAQNIISSIPLYFKLDMSEELTVESFAANKENFAISLKKHLQLVEYATGSTIFNRAIPNYRNFSNTTNCTTNGSWFNEGGFILNNGMTFYIDNDNTLWISVDLNGHKKKPNRYGYDLFTFELAKKIGYYNESSIKAQGKIYPVGHPHTYYTSTNLCSKTSTDEHNGATCAYQATKNANYFKELMY